MKKILSLFIAILIFVPALSFAEGKVGPTVGIIPSQPIAGKAPNGDVNPINTDGLGNLEIIANIPSVATLNFNTTITLAGAANRTQLASHVVTSCLFQAPLGNTGIIYSGGSTVTNVSGANVGLALVQGDVIGPISMGNTNEMYFATDNANDVVSALCK